jgi:hypothetical protein
MENIRKAIILELSGVTTKTGVLTISTAQQLVTGEIVEIEGVSSVHKSLTVPHAEPLKSNTHPVCVRCNYPWIKKI